MEGNYFSRDYYSPFSPRDLSQQPTLPFPLTHVPTLKTAGEMTLQWCFVARPVSTKKQLYTTYQYFKSLRRLFKKIGIFCKYEIKLFK